MKVSNRQLAEAILRELQAGKSLASVSRSLAAYLVTERRSKDAEAIVRNLGDLLEQEAGQVEIMLTSATKLSETLQKNLAQILAPTAKKRIINQTIDPTVLGGVLVESGDQRLDLTVRRQIQRLKGVNV